MADISDVSSAIVALIAGVVYPSGINQPSITGAGIRIYEGWPNPQQLDTDLKAGVCHISVFTRPEERNTTRFPLDWQQQSLNTATLTLTANGQTVTVGGAMPNPFTRHNLVIFANGKPYVYAVQSGDTLNSIAAALSALIAVDIPTTSATGATITLPSSARLGAVRVGITGTAIREVRRQERSFQVTIWADTPTHRNSLASPVDVALSIAKFLTLTDGTSARIVYKSSMVTDGQQNEKLYRRDLIYSVEYATTQTDTQTQITQEQWNTSATVQTSTADNPIKTTFA
ncbi:MAG: hypothetical protein ACXWAT_00885 [Methylobacter sp.]